MIRTTVAIVRRSRERLSSAVKLAVRFIPGVPWIQSVVAGKVTRYELIIRARLKLRLRMLLLQGDGSADAVHGPTLCPSRGLFVRDAVEANCIIAEEPVGEGLAMACGDLREQVHPSAERDRVQELPQVHGRFDHHFRQVGKKLRPRAG